MRLKRVKILFTSLLILTFGLVVIQIWAILTGAFSILLPFLMLGLLGLSIKQCGKIATLPNLVEIKDLRWDLAAMKNLKFELLFLSLVTLVPLLGSLVPLPLAAVSPELLLGGSLLYLLLQSCLVLASCCQLVITLDLLEQAFDLFDRFQAALQLKEESESNTKATPIESAQS